MLRYTLAHIAVHAGPLLSTLAHIAAHASPLLSTLAHIAVHAGPLLSTLAHIAVHAGPLLGTLAHIAVHAGPLLGTLAWTLCEVMKLNPVRILMAMMIYSNIGGATTPVGDPPNVIIVSTPEVVNAIIVRATSSVSAGRIWPGVNFLTFCGHMTVGIVLVAIVIFFQLRFIFRDINGFRFTDPHDVEELRHEITIWQRAAESLSSYSRDEDVVRGSLQKKVKRLLDEMKIKLASGSVSIENYKANLVVLQKKPVYPIRDWPLLLKCIFVLAFVITLFFMHNVPELKLSMGWAALLGALLLLILADNPNMEGVLARVEWSTLIFFASLFILMEALSQLGMINWIGAQAENIILLVGKEYQLAVAIIIILWVSALASSFVDNIPLTTMMVRIIISLSQNKNLDLPLQPLVWALAFGACLGGIESIVIVKKVELEILMNFDVSRPPESEKYSLKENQDWVSCYVGKHVGCNRLPACGSRCLQLALKPPNIFFAFASQIFE
uniref:Citrate transporter-like domain-containing protein n=1 Tax=Timema tahoe TaxID=61484 RepID=A0A7R9IQM5_9NEOP|nr:unnamed protein product [Timema tahoe]